MEIERTVEFLELQLIRSAGALAIRFVILCFLYHLAQVNDFLSAESAPLLRDAVWPHFERFVGLLIQEPGPLPPIYIPAKAYRPKP